MQPFTNVSLPLSIAQIDSTVYLEPCISQTPSANDQPPATADGWQEHMLSALATRSAEVEAAEWALDHSVSVRDEQIIAALTARLPAKLISAVTGLTVTKLEQIEHAQAPAPTGQIAS